ncbi:MAG TPA: hypothetical protein VKP65_05035 [Rhodothermales bacterium]|nr:hypothetical protein [Rhodothermales bacterium]
MWAKVLNLDAQPPRHAQIQKALRWIAGILEEMEVPFQVVGGLAAQVYGATRPLVDIDLYIPNDCFDEVRLRVKECVTFGPEHVKNPTWDITFMALDYEGERIELGGAEGTKIFDRHMQRWTQEEIDFTKAERRTIYGVEVPVMPRARLIDYKRKLSRRVDLDDIREMEAADQTAPGSVSPRTA